MKSIIASAIAAMSIVSCGGPVYAQKVEAPLEVRVEACLELSTDVIQILDMYSAGSGPELTYAVVVDNEVLSPFQRWILANYLLAIYLDEGIAPVGIEVQHFMLACINHIGEGQLDVTPSSDSNMVRDDSRRPV